MPKRRTNTSNLFHKFSPYKIRTVKIKAVHRQELLVRYDENDYSLMLENQRSTKLTEFGLELSAWLDGTGVTQSKLAQTMGIHHSTIGKLIAGQRAVSAKLEAQIRQKMKELEQEAVRVHALPCDTCASDSFEEKSAPDAHRDGDSAESSMPVANNICESDIVIPLIVFRLNVIKRYSLFSLFVIFVILVIRYS